MFENYTTPVCMVLLVALLSWQCTATRRGHSSASNYCQSHMISMDLYYDGCQSRHVITKTCAGSCYSFSLPRGPRNGQFPVFQRGDQFIESCKCCIPAENSVPTKTIYLNCTGNRRQAMEVPRADRCHCRPCYHSNTGLHTAGSHAIPEEQHRGEYSERPASETREEDVTPASQTQEEDVTPASGTQKDDAAPSMVPVDIFSVDNGLE